MKTLLELQAATIAARAKVGDKHISTRVSGGLIDVVRAVPPANMIGPYDVAVICSGLTPAQAIKFLGEMK